jgi:hypothetical protein
MASAATKRARNELSGGSAPLLPSFHRGDADDNGRLELTDAVRILC